MGVGLPVLGTCLLCRVRPEVGVLYIRKELHAVFGSAFAYFCGSFQIGVTAAVAVAVVVMGLVPYPYADVVDTVIGEYGEQVCLVAVVVIELHASFL